MATNRSQKLKYLGVEMLKNDATKSSKPEVGLFRGIRERSDGKTENPKSIRLMLLGTKDKENDLRALNLEVFNVLSMKMLYGDTKELIVFKNSAADQEEAIKLLTECLKEFQEEKRMVDNDPEIVDISTFEDVPQEFFAPKEVKSTTTHNYGYGNTYTGGDNSDWKKKQEEREKEKERQEKLRWTPMMIGRKGELPGIKAMNAIKKKVVALAGGEYEENFTDPDPKDTFVDDKKTTTTV